MSAAESTVVSDVYRLKAIKRIDDFFRLLAPGDRHNSVILTVISDLLSKAFLNNADVALTALSLKNNFNTLCGEISEILENCIDPSNRIHALGVCFNFSDYEDNICLFIFVEGRPIRSNPIPMELIANLLRNDDSIVKVAKFIEASEASLTRFEGITRESEHDEDSISRGPTF